MVIDMRRYICDDSRDTHVARSLGCCHLQSGRLSLTSSSPVLSCFCPFCCLRRRRILQSLPVLCALLRCTPFAALHTATAALAAPGTAYCTPCPPLPGSLPIRTYVLAYIGHRPRDPQVPELDRRAPFLSHPSSPARVFPCDLPAACSPARMHFQNLRSRLL